jgi:hypothetical protein
VQSKVCLILTATIIPNSIKTVISDYFIRRNEYLLNLQYYKNKVNLDIYFIENSGYDFSVDSEFLNEFDNTKVVLIKFQRSNEYDLGKGYQEFKMLDECINQIKQKYSHFIKISGRYKVLNIDYYLKKFDYRKVECSMDRYDSQSSAKSNFFICSSHFYMIFFYGIYKHSDDRKNLFIEKVIFSRSKLGDFNRNFQFFDKTPQILAISGSTGQNLRNYNYIIALNDIDRRLLKILKMNSLSIMPSLSLYRCIASLIKN